MTRRKMILIAVGVIIFGVAVFVLIVKANLSKKEDKAIQLAQEYLSKKYTQEMQYQDVRFSRGDPSLYHVSFTSSNFSDLLFEVLVQRDLTILSDYCISEKEISSADNYYIKYFERSMELYLSKTVRNLWGDDTKVSVIQMNSGLYSFSVPVALKDTQLLSEMEELVENYWVYIGTGDSIFDNEFYEVNSKKIFEFIQILKRFEVSPDVLSFQYFVSKDKTMEVYFKDWVEIESVNEVLEKLMDSVQNN